MKSAVIRELDPRIQERGKREARNGWVQEQVCRCLDARIKSAHDGGEVRSYPALMGGFVYVMSNKRDGTLYIGVTTNLSRRVYEHREKQTKGFTQRYGLHRLVYYESFDDIRAAIQREKTLKHWPRLWKLALIQDVNPDWADLYEALNR